MKLKYKTLIRLVALLLTFTLVLTGCGSGSRAGSDLPEEDSQHISNTPELIEALVAANGKVSGLSLETIKKIASKNHEPLTIPNDLYAHDMTQYYQADSGLLTQEEINALREKRDKAAKISKEEAITDADLFFRTWKYAFAGYYMMGEDLFLNARDEVMSQLENLDGKISGQDLANMLYASMNFLQDAHSSIDNKAPASTEDNLRYQYYFDNSVVFSKDDKGYYVTFDDGNWYYSNSSNPALRIEPTLLEDGRVVYCPMLMVPVAERSSSDSITLVNGDRTVDIWISWTAAADVQGSNMPDNTQCITETIDDIYYINYLDMYSQNGDINEFFNTAYEAREHDVVIFDLRHTMGWEHWQLLQWIEFFSGEYPAINETKIVRNNALRTLENFGGFKLVGIGEEEIYLKSDQGKLIKNDIPVIIITDKSVASSIESALTFLKTLENSIVIGANTHGCQLGGSVQEYYLPYSGVPFAISGFNEFYGEPKNIDGIGYEPDLWCNPETALDAAIEMLKPYDFSDDDSADAIEENSDPATGDLKVLFAHNKILPDQCFGDMTYEGCEISVLVDNRSIKDFTVTSSDENYLLIEKLDNGRLILKKKQDFKSNVPFTITYNGEDYLFYTND